MILSIITVNAQAGNSHIIDYQELCAKESNPLKRQSYCRTVQNSIHADGQAYNKQKETAYG